MANLDKLNTQFSLKNVDTEKLIKTMSAQRNSLIKLVLIIGTLVLAGVMFNNQRLKAEDLRSRMTKVQEKLAAIKERDAAIKDLNDFKSSLPKKLNELELITLISKYAKLQHITIASLSPAESKDMGLYDVIDVSLNAVSDNYRGMMFFLRKIEKSDFPLMINSWSGQEEDDGKMTFTIEISAVLIHV